MAHMGFPKIRVPFWGGLCSKEYVGAFGFHIEVCLFRETTTSKPQKISLP